jgi:hypothetical protein
MAIFSLAVYRWRLMPESPPSGQRMINQGMTNNEMDKGKKGTVDGDVDVVHVNPDPCRFKLIQS